jgi:hypothetical protein
VPESESSRLARLEEWRVHVDDELELLSARADRTHKRMGALEADRLALETARAALETARRANSDRLWRVVTVASAFGGVLIGHFLPR